MEAITADTMAGTTADTMDIMMDTMGIMMGIMDIMMGIMMDIMAAGMATVAGLAMAVAVLSWTTVAAMSSGTPHQRLLFPYRLL